MTNIKATRIYHNEWIAVDDDTYDGAPDSKSLCGVGASEQEAINDLHDKMDDALREHAIQAAITEMSLSGGNLDMKVRKAIERYETTLQAGRKENAKAIDFYNLPKCGN